MDQQSRSLRIGAAVIVCAVLFRLASGGFFAPVTDLLREPDAASFLLYMETGRTVQAAALGAPEDITPVPAEAAETEPEETEPATEPAETEPATEPTEAPTIPANSLPERQPAVFTAADRDFVKLRCEFAFDADITALVTQDLDWDLTARGPSVLILHTHATESFTKDGEDYQESGSYRTLDRDYNMVSVGDRLTELLQAGGVMAIHDRVLYDYPSYDGSYYLAEDAIKNYLEEYPSIRMVLDLHRDAAEDENGRQVGRTVQVDGEDMAQLMFVLGSDYGLGRHPNWQENFALAMKLQILLEKSCPDLGGLIKITDQRYNQQLSPGALLIEVGAAGNTRAEALASMEPLAEAILALSKGAVGGE